MGIPRDFQPPPRSAENPIVLWHPRPRVVLLLGIALWASAYVLAMATLTDQRWTALFLPAGVGVGLLLRLPVRLWGWVLLVIAVTDVLIGSRSVEGTVALGVVLAATNVTQTVILALLLRALGVDMTRARDTLILTVCAGVVTASVGALGFLVLQWLHLQARTSWWSWWFSEVLGVVLVVPLMLLVGRASTPRDRRAAWALFWFAAPALVIAVELPGRGLLGFPDWVWLAASTPLLVLFGVRFGLLALAGSMLGFSLLVMSVSATAGPPPDPFGQHSPVTTLQFLLLLVTVSVETVAMLVLRLLRHGRTLASQQALLDAVIENSPVPTALLDPEEPDRVLRTNRAYRDLLTADGAETATSLLDYFPVAERQPLARALSMASASHEPVMIGEFATTDGQGEPLLVRLRIVAVAADAFDRYGSLRRGVNLARVVHLEDMTDVRRRENRLRRDATTDPLTGLSNRRHLMSVLRSELTWCRPDHQLAVIYVDLDGFKGVNDRFGHTTGDRLLQEVAGRLRAAVRPEDLVARSGGDEFVVVSTGLPNREKAQLLAERVLANLETVSDASEPLRASVGLELVDAPGRTAQEVLDMADRSMYRAKSAGGSRVSDQP